MTISYIAQYSRKLEFRISINYIAPLNHPYLIYDNLPSNFVIFSFKALIKSASCFDFLSDCVISFFDRLSTSCSMTGRLTILSSEFGHERKRKNFELYARNYDFIEILRKRKLSFFANKYILYKILQSMRRMMLYEDSDIIDIP